MTVFPDIPYKNNTKEKGKMQSVGITYKKMKNEEKQFLRPELKNLSFERRNPLSLNHLKQETQVQVHLSQAWEQHVQEKFSLDVKPYHGSYIKDIGV